MLAFYDSLVDKTNCRITLVVQSFFFLVFFFFFLPTPQDKIILPVGHCIEKFPHSIHQSCSTILNCILDNFLVIHCSSLVLKFDLVVPVLIISRM